MSYSPPAITSAGLSIPTYVDIRDDLIAQMKNIYGSDLYLGVDSLDYQFISAIALKHADDIQAVQLAYNNRSPSTAIGSGLDGLVKLNGIKRKVASYSTCIVVLTGTPNTEILKGMVSDISNNQWSLPDSATIGLNGTVEVVATCKKIGSITAQPRDIINISTPTYGWISVVNNVSAVVGQPVETDSELRSRQSISTELPSKTLLQGTIAGIAGVTGVNRYKVLENDTSMVDYDGLPPHSITAVVEGGTDDNIAQQIYARKNIGCYTNGTTVVNIPDDYGVTAIRFYRPTYKQIYATLTVHALYGYTTAVTSTIQNSINDYVNSLQIGEDLTISALWSVAMSANPNLKQPIFSLRSVIAGTSSNLQNSADIPLAFNEVTQSLNPLNIVINVI